MFSEIALELIEKELPISSVVGRNKRDNQMAFAAAPLLLILMPLAVGFLWYGVSVVGPTISVMPSTGFAPSSSDFILFVIVYGRWPEFNDWVVILVGAGLAPFIAIGIAWALLQLGVVGATVLEGFLCATGIGITIAAAIIAA